MAEQDRLVEAVVARLETDHTVNLHAARLQVLRRDAGVRLEGSVPTVAAKRRAAVLAAAVPGVQAVEDGLRVAAAEPMGDGAIRDHLRDALLAEPVFSNHLIRQVDRQGKVEAVRGAAPEQAGEILISVEDGVVSLEGVAATPSHRRIAGVLAWWVPGTEDVHNKLVVDPPRRDTDDDLAEAVKLVLEMDRLVQADQIGVHAEAFCVTLAGNARDNEQRQLAERDAWLVEGVRSVENKLVVP